MSIKTVSIGLLVSLGLSAAAFAAPVKSGAGPSLTGGTFIDFEGQAQGDATSLYTGVGVTFSALAGLPVIDNDPFSFGYAANSGVGVLSINTAPAGITMTFAAAQSFVEFFLSDTAPLGDYTVSAFDSSDTLLESVGLSLAELSGDSSFWLGFDRASADIVRISIVPTSSIDAFAVDDLRFGASAVPIPASWALAGLGLAVLGVQRRRSRG